MNDTPVLSREAIEAWNSSELGIANVNEILNGKSDAKKKGESVDVMGNMNVRKSGNTRES
jgi:hypothetical protein